MHGVGKASIQMDLKTNRLIKQKRGSNSSFFITLYVVEMKNSLRDYVIENVLKEQFIDY